MHFCGTCWVISVTKAAQVEIEKWTSVSPCLGPAGELVQARIRLHGREAAAAAEPYQVRALRALGLPPGSILLHFLSSKRKQVLWDTLGGVGFCRSLHHTSAVTAPPNTVHRTTQYRSLR